MRTLSLMAIGAGAAYYAMTMDKKTKKRWKKRIDNVNFLEEFDLDDIMPTKRQMKRYRRRVKRAIS
ncbi:hypothetical protein CR205_09495 [Alteribacter lacisalsi]|jgi:hypothetical protein|uniref:Uncharacterized protein n=1 Tax=Alteribacter lacisalsi TaxID=2045244 RepID=A0A2W0HD21_9BACI|nr:hypothetical protein [Alteribacter lacisalsi]PYZ98786.1 hypothetical protein CR205_09495 [Alteribacter lacisalsi]